MPNKVYVYQEFKITDTMKGIIPWSVAQDKTL